jgi:hypothetical protein
MTKKQIDHQPAIAPALRILSLGWGVQSWTLAAMAALRDCGCALCRRWGVDKLPALDYAIHADTTWEREITYQFAEEQTPWLEAHGAIFSSRHTLPICKVMMGRSSASVPAAGK